MGKVAIFDEEQVKTFEYDEDTDVTLSYLTKEEAVKLNKEVDKIVARTAADWTLVWNQKLGERVIKGWNHRTNRDHPGFIMPNGTPIPFNPVNRDMMIKRNREFSLFVGHNAVDPQVFLELKEETQESQEVKND
jgi:hypothetical protein